MYDQYKVNLKARVLQVSIDQSKMSFQTSLCWNQKFKSKWQELGFWKCLWLKHENKFWKLNKQSQTSEKYLQGGWGLHLHGGPKSFFGWALINQKDLIKNFWQKQSKENVFKSLKWLVFN